MRKDCGFKTRFWRSSSKIQKHYKLCDILDIMNIKYDKDECDNMMEKGTFLLIDTKPIGLSTEVQQVIVELMSEFIYTVECITTQPIWWTTKIVYSKTDVYKVDDEVNICVPYLKELSYKIISKENVLAMVI